MRWILAAAIVLALMAGLVCAQGAALVTTTAAPDAATETALTAATATQAAATAAPGTESAPATAAATTAPTTATAAADAMEITAIDLLAENCGEATMISDGSGKSLLVDSGDNKNRSIFQWLNENGYKNRTFDTLITHWHDDHAGNTAEIIRKYRIGTLYIPDPGYLDVDDPDYKSHYEYEKTYVPGVLEAARERGTKIVYLKKGMTIKVGTVKGEVLYCSDSPRSENWYGVQYVNNQSAVIMFTGGGSKLLMAGDIQMQAERRILRSDVSIKADIFKLSHHGMDRSNTQRFIATVRPSFAWFTSNSSSPRQYLTDDVRDSVTRMGQISNVFSTRYNGTIKYRCAGGRITVTAERNTSKMYQRLIHKTTGAARNVTYTFNNACEVHVTDKIMNRKAYYNRQLDADGKVFTGIWKLKGGEYYLRSGNIYAVSTFAIKDGQVYYFDESGKRQSGFTSAYGRTYYFDPYRVRGFKKIGDATYYFLNSKCPEYDTSKVGMMMTGSFTVDGKRYFADKDGKVK